MKQVPLIPIAITGFVLSMICFAFFDTQFYHLAKADTPEALAIWKRITFLGDSSWMAVVCLSTMLFAWIMRTKQPENGLWNKILAQCKYVFAAVAIPGITVLIIKGIIGRARPKLFETEGPFGFNMFSFQSQYASYPSGHTTTAFALAVAITLLYPRTAYVALPLAILAGFSRTVVGAHYIGDVFAGATLGSVMAILVYRWLAPKLKL